MLTPYTLGGTNPIYLKTKTGVYKSTVSMPEEGFVADLGIILLAVPWVMRRMRFA
jgi:hypothetical protein